MTLTTQETEKLKEWADKTFFQPNNLSLDSYDINAELDLEVSAEENKTLLRDKLQVFFKENPTKTDIKNEIELQNNQVLEHIKEVEEESKKHFEAYLYELKQKPSLKLDKFNILEHYIKAVARGFSNGLIILGSQGTAKTFTTRQTLIKENVCFIESRGVTSPMALYEFLYNNNDKNKVLLFDDVANLINNENAFSILLGALWDGLVCWNSTTDKLKIAKQFIFNGKIIIIANRLNGFQADIVKSRCLVYNLILDREDKISLMYSIARTEKEGLSIEERQEIVNFIKDNTDNSSIFDLRTQQKAEQLYLYSKTKWRELLKPLLAKDDIKEMALYCIKNNPTTTQAEKEFMQGSGYSRRQFYYILKQMKGGVIQNV